jgi:VanZ family protein
MLPTLATLVLDQRLRRGRLCSALLMFAAILAMGSIPGARAQIGHVGPGIILHSIAYASLTFLLYTGTEGGRGRRALQAFLIVAVMGALDELVQSFLPYRNGTVADWLIDCNAAMITAVLLWRFMPQARAAGHASPERR